MWLILGWWCCFDLLIHCNTSVRFVAFAQTSARKFTIHLWNSVWSRNFADASPRRDNPELSCHLSTQVQIPKAWLVIDMRLICRLDFFSLLLKSKVKVLIAMILRSHYSQIPSLLISPRHHQRFPMVLPNFLNHCVIHENLVEHVDDQKRFQGYSYSLVYFAEVIRLLSKSGS